MKNVRIGNNTKCENKAMVFLLILCISILSLLSQEAVVGDENFLYPKVETGIYFATSLILPESALADTKTAGAGGVDVTMNSDGTVILDGGNTSFNDTENNSWNDLFGRYKKIIVGISGFATLTMLAAFIFLFVKLGTVSGNEKARKEVITGILFTGIATAALGSVTIIMGFFYNAFGGI